MERLTAHIGDTVGMAWEHEEKHTMDEWVDILQTRLCEYEDTGLYPEEVKKVLDAYTRTFGKGVSFKRIQELIRADREERVLVLPCPIGATVYMHSPLCWENGKATFEGCVFSRDCTHWGPLRCPLKVVEGTFSVNMHKRVGQTYWLTREEAEAAIPADSRP